LLLQRNFLDTIKEYDHIIPALLKRIWQQDNNMKAVTWELGQQGGVSGDAFVKVAYEPAWEDEAEIFIPEEFVSFLLILLIVSLRGTHTIETDFLSLN